MLIIRFPLEDSFVYKLKAAASEATTSLNSYIQQFCVSNGFYLVENSTQNNLYYINVLFNDTYYANQIIFKTVPTAIPAGFTAPANWAGYPTVSRTPYVEILNTNHFDKFIGFTPEMVFRAADL
jgi:hypothetical protein